MLSTRTSHALEDIIVALATPAEPSERAVVRLSGTGCHDLIFPLFRPPIAPPGWPTVSKRRWVEGTISLPGLFGSIPCSVHLWPRGGGYTRQEAAELHFVGSMPLLEWVIQNLVAAGARPAQPGEFSLRAFLSGSIDLSQAEAVVAISKAKQPAELALAMEQLAGGIRHPAEELRRELLDLLADLEAGLDFAEEDITFVDSKRLILSLGSFVARIINLRRQMREKDTQTPLPRVALVGPPNAGKSTLFNLLVGGQSQAIVSDIPGTTRDWLEGTGPLPCGTRVNWMDTAGLSDTPLGELDLVSQKATWNLLPRADLIVACLPLQWIASLDLLKPMPWDVPLLVVQTLADLHPTGEMDELRVSSHTGEGIGLLKARVSEVLKTNAEANIPPLARCQTQLEQAEGAIRRAHRQAVVDDPIEVLVLEIRVALDALGEMTGVLYTDDLLDRVFTRFCIGK